MGEENKYTPKNKDTPPMIITLSLDIGIRQQKHREDDGDDVPAGEDESMKGERTM